MLTTALLLQDQAKLDRVLDGKDLSGLRLRVASSNGEASFEIMEFDELVRSLEL